MTNTAIIIAYVAKILAEIKALLARLVRGDSLKPYRPERHYMRGPGPQWLGSLPFAR
jgi:hypothetical protein